MRADIRAAVWTYRTAAGQRRVAYFGDVVDLTEDEYARAEHAGVLKPEAVLDRDVPFVVFDGGEVGTGDDEQADGDAAGDQGDDDQADGDGDGDDEQADDGSESAAVPRPASTTSPKAEWHAYAVSRGIPAEEAGRMSRAEIAARLPEA